MDINQPKDNHQNTPNLILNMFIGQKIGKKKSNNFEMLKYHPKFTKLKEEEYTIPFTQAISSIIINKTPP